MNDFTKKELIAIEDALEQMLILHRPQDGKSLLQEKIHSMIDNYCDHKWQLNNQLKCNKCGVKVG
jgi:hypothetical protein